MENLQKRFESFFNEIDELGKDYEDLNNLERVTNILLNLLEVTAGSTVGFSLYETENGYFDTTLWLRGWNEPKDFSEIDDAFLSIYYSKERDKYSYSIHKSVTSNPIVKALQEKIRDIHYDERILHEIKNMILNVRKPKKITLSSEEHCLYVKF